MFPDKLPETVTFPEILTFPPNHAFPVTADLYCVVPTPIAQVESRITVVLLIPETEFELKVVVPPYTPTPLS